MAKPTFPYQQLALEPQFREAAPYNVTDAHLQQIAQSLGYSCGITTVGKARRLVAQSVAQSVPKRGEPVEYADEYSFETAPAPSAHTAVSIKVSDAPTFDSLGAKPVRKPEFQAHIGGIRVTTLHEPDEIDPIDFGRKIFDRFQDSSSEYLGSRHERAQDLVEYHIESTKPILLVHFGDLHIGTKGTNHALARHHAELVRDTPGAFALFGGDGVDNFIKHQSAMISSTSTPREQYSALEYWLSIFGADKLLGGITGNHDFWTSGIGGVDYLRDLFRRLKVPYVPHRLRLVLNLNNIKYSIELRHSYRFKSSVNLSNGLQRMWEHSDWEWDIGLLCHTHDGPFMFPFVRHSRTRWGGLCGSYKVHDDHGQQWGYNDACANSTAFLLNPQTHEITGFNSIEKGIEYLRALTSPVEL